MKISIYSKDNLNQIDWSEIENGERLKHFYLPLLEYGTKQFVTNSDHTIHLLKLGSQVVPLSIGRKTKCRSSYIFSFLSQYVDYTREEILANDKYSLSQKRIVKFVFPALRVLGGWMGMERVVFVNNYMLATNLYQNLKEIDFEAVVNFLKEHFKKRSIVFRSVDEGPDTYILESLKELGGIPLVCRQLYMLNPETSSFRKKRPFIQDRKLWEKTEDLYWQKVEQMTDEEKDITIKYYKDLYLNKYSELNPWYTPQFLAIALEGDMLDFYFLRDKTSEKVMAVQAVARENNIICTPFIGYDQDAPKEKGLYRLMNVQLTQLAVDGRKILNMSSGASKFKKQRGGEPCFEYHVVFCDHLPKRRQLIWKKIFNYSEKEVKKTMTDLEL